MATHFMSVYITEKMLSIDNLFVILLIFSYFLLEEKYHHRALFYGILGAIIFHAVFIVSGTFIISKFHWILYVFGTILIYTGIKLFGNKKEKHIDFERNKIIKFVRRFLPFSDYHHNGKFIIKQNG